MNKEEFKKLVKGMRAVYTSDRFLPDEDSLKMWYALLQDIPYNIASKAIQTYMYTNKYPPTVADVREQSVKAIRGENKTWGEAWNEVLTAIRLHGSGDIRGAYMRFDEITLKTVKAVGYIDMCQCTDITPYRANFRMIYEQLQAQEMERLKLPQNFKVLVSNQMQISENNNDEQKEKSSI